MMLISVVLLGFESTEAAKRTVLSSGGEFGSLTSDSTLNDLLSEND